MDGWSVGRRLLRRLWLPLLLLIKIFAWWYTGSVSILAALVDSLVDIAASLTNLLRSADIPYSLLTKNIPLVMAKRSRWRRWRKACLSPARRCSCFLMAFNTPYLQQRMTDPPASGYRHIDRPNLYAGAGDFPALGGAKTQSQAVRADMLHYQSDVMMNGAILVALGLSWYGWHRADALFALGIGIYILYSALRMGYEAVQSLLDRALPDEERQDIITIVTACRVLAGRTIFANAANQPTRFIQIHLEMEDSCLWFRLHIVGIREQAILRRFPGPMSIIHQGPSSVKAKRRSRAFLSVRL